MKIKAGADFFRKMKESRDKEQKGGGFSARNFSLVIEGKEMIGESNFSLNPGEKIALIGRNGSGKSTFLSLIEKFSRGEKASEHIETKGSLKIFPGARIGFLPQDLQLNFTGSVDDYLFAAGEEITLTIRRFQELSKIIESDPTSQEKAVDYNNIIARMNEFDAWSYQAKRTSVLQGFGIVDDYLKRQIGEISGGEASRLALAALILSPANLYLLDEPTNNLDIKGLLFLNKFLQESSHSILLVSHDRSFLESVGQILEIDEETHYLRNYGGNYSFYHQRKEEEFKGRLRQYREQQQKRKQLEESIKELDSQAQRFENFSRDAFKRSQGAKIAKRAKVQKARLKDELSRLPEPQLPAKPSFIRPEIVPDKGLIVSVSDTDLGYSEEKPILKDFSLKLYAGDRVGVIGPNGVGKSTLLRALNNQGGLLKGNIEIKGNIKTNYLPQSADLSRPEEKILPFMEKNFSINETIAKRVLGQLLLSQLAHLKIGDFSVGEIRKIAIGCILASNPNFLILDEPTNHLDLYTIEMLEETLESYAGGILVVSHDERFLENIKIKKLIIFKELNNVEINEISSFQEIKSIFQSFLP